MTNHVSRQLFAKLQITLNFSSDDMSPVGVRDVCTSIEQ